MKNEITNEMASRIADLILNKSFWGDEWFVLFSLLLVGLVSAVSAWAGTYLTTRSQNAAIRADFTKALTNLEKQTKSVKSIEEGITHNFIEKRELLKIKRNKIEELYLSLTEDMSQLSHNLGVATSDIKDNIIMPSNKVEMLASLYFKDELEKEMEYFRQQRRVLITRTNELAKENLLRTGKSGEERVIENAVYFKNYNQSKINIEIALEGIIKELNK